MTNTKSDIPQDGGGIPHEGTDLDLPDLPGEWEWGSVNHYEMTNKVNVFFHLGDLQNPGAQYGEIDNYHADGGEKWDIHVRPIVELSGPPEDDDPKTRPRGEAETVEHFDTLGEAIESVPDHIATYYPEE